METKFLKSVKAFHRKQTNLNADCAKWSFSLLEYIYSLIHIYYVFIISNTYMYFKISS